MIVIFESKLPENSSGYLISRYPDIHPFYQKKDNPHIAEKKVIFDFLRSSDNQKFHFRMWLRFIFISINSYLTKNKKTEILSRLRPEKEEKGWISGYLDIRYPRGNL